LEQNVDPVFHPNPVRQEAAMILQINFYAAPLKGMLARLDLAGPGQLRGRLDGLAPYVRGDKPIAFAEEHVITPRRLR
jgi:hypothetical protein